MSLDKRTRKIIKKIYRNPYITIDSLKQFFPQTDTEEILSWLDEEKYISFREASCAENDQGYEKPVYDGNAHVVPLRKGRIEAEDHTLFRANMALIISSLSLVLSVIAFICL